MIQSLKIRGFRAFQSFDLRDLTRVNLLVGRNNAGKSCILDAVDIAALGGPFYALLNSPIRRGEYGVAASVDGGSRVEVQLSHLFHGHLIESDNCFELITERKGGFESVLAEVENATSDKNPPQPDG
jgi:hypothetical protein